MIAVDRIGAVGPIGVGLEQDADAATAMVEGVALVIRAHVVDQQPAYYDEETGEYYDEQGGYAR